MNATEPFAPEDPARARRNLITQAFAVNHLGQRCYYETLPQFRGVVAGWCTQELDLGPNVVVLCDEHPADGVGGPPGSGDESGLHHLLDIPPGRFTFYIPVSSVVLLADPPAEDPPA